MDDPNIFYIELLVGDGWMRYAGPFKNYQKAVEYYGIVTFPRKRLRFARYERMEILKIEEE